MAKKKCKKKAPPKQQPMDDGRPQAPATFPQGPNLADKALADLTKPRDR